jgi:hypothetical protein
MLRANLTKSNYIGDRVSKSFRMPSLAELIGAKKSLTFD